MPRVLQMMTDWVQLADETPGEIVIVSDYERRTFWSLMGGKAFQQFEKTKSYDDYIEDGGQILCHGKRLVTPEELQKMITKAGDEETTGHYQFKVRMLAVFGRSEHGDERWGHCHQLHSGKFSNMKPGLFQLLSELPDKSMIEISRPSYTERHWYHVWDEEFDI